MEIDLTKLSRDYKENPLGRFEPIPEVDLRYLYLETNLSSIDIAGIIGRCHSNVAINIKKYKLVKTKEQRAQCRRNTNLKRYGCINVSQNKKIQIKKLETSLERYGTVNPFQNKEFQQKQQETNLARYGAKNAMQNKLVQNKYKQKYLKRTGYETPFASPQTQQKCKQTMLQRYNASNPQKVVEFIEKTQETRLKKYGSKYIYGSEYFKKKSVETLVKRYKVINPRFILKVQELWSTPSYVERIKQKLRAKSSETIKKIIATKRKNGTFRTSAPEERCYNKLITRFPDILRQYRSELYPFACDFFIPSLNLYIEYQGHEGHGDEPFDLNNEDHISIVKQWSQRAQELNFKGIPKKKYLSYIKTWTISDPLKREIAKKNNLNWIEFFTEKQFDEWYDQL